MKKLLSFFLLLFSMLLIAAEEQPAAPIQNENPSVQQNDVRQPEKKRFTQLKFGLGADFEGVAGRPLIEDARYSTLRNQLGISLGVDFGWVVFQKTEGKGAGDFCIGLGLDFQYWVPTTHMSPDNHIQSSDYDKLRYIYSHYMRLPVTLNMSYEFKVNAGAIRRVGPLFSIGMNNNFFKFSYSFYDGGDHENWDEIDRQMSHYKISGTWELGIGMVFENNWLLNVSIGGDFGSQNLKSYLLYSKEEAGKEAHILYDRHEFLMFETGYRF